MFIYESGSDEWWLHENAGDHYLSWWGAGQDSSGLSNDILHTSAILYDCLYWKCQKMQGKYNFCIVHFLLFFYYF